VRCADRTAEFLEKFIGVFDKGFYVNFQANEYRWGFVEDKAPFSRVHRAIQPRRWLKFLPVTVSSPHKKARRTQRETTWYHGVSDKDTRDDRGRVMGYLYLEWLIWSMS
jgi:hypothetical protein